MGILHLHLKHKYYDEVSSGIKKEELRQCTDYWAKRIVNVEYDKICIHKGFTQQKKMFDYCGYITKKIKHEHFGPNFVHVFALPLKTQKKA